MDRLKTGAQGVNPINHASTDYKQIISQHYDQFEQKQYRKPTEGESKLLWQVVDNANGLDHKDLDRIRILSNTMLPDEQVRLHIKELVVTSFAGMHLLLEHRFPSHPNTLEMMNEAYRSFTDIDNTLNSTKNLSDPKQLKDFINTYLIDYINHLANTVVDYSGEDFDEVVKLLDSAQKLAHFEHGKKYNKVIATVTKFENQQHVMLTKPISELTEKQKQEFGRLQPDSGSWPQWFQALDPVIQSWILKHKDSLIAGEFPSPPSSLKFFPQGSNFHHHYTAIFNEQGKMQMQGDLLRRGVIQPIAVKNKVERHRLGSLAAEQERRALGTRKRFTEYWGEGLAQILKENGVKPVHMNVSLLSPGLVTHSTDQKMYDENKKIIQNQEKDIKILVPNWGINVVRHLTKRFNKENKHTRDELYDSFRTHVQSMANHFGQAELFKPLMGDQIDFEALPTLIKKLKNQNNWEKQLFPNDSNRIKAKTFLMGLEALVEFQKLWCHHNARVSPNKELLAVVYQVLIAKSIGSTVTLHCKSGKDRTAIAVLLYSKTLGYYDKHDRLPKYNDSPQQLSEFYKDVAPLYSSGQMQACAALNFPGTDGLKLDGEDLVNKIPFRQISPMLANDLKAEINATPNALPLKTQHTLAGLNGIFKNKNLVKRNEKHGKHANESAGNLGLYAGNPDEKMHYPNSSAANGQQYALDGEEEPSLSDLQANNPHHIFYFKLTPSTSLKRSGVLEIRVDWKAIKDVVHKWVDSIKHTGSDVKKSSDTANTPPHSSNRYTMFSEELDLTTKTAHKPGDIKQDQRPVGYAIK